MNRFTRNKNLKYYEDYPLEGNCGSFALRIEEWYEPDDSLSCDNNDYAEHRLFCDGEYEDIVLDEILERNLLGMKKDFGDEIRVLEDENDIKEDEELIAFRVGMNVLDDWVETDFHYRVLRNGKWQEKLGAGPVIPETKLEKDCSWNTGGWIYDSNIVFLAHKLGALA